MNEESLEHRKALIRKLGMAVLLRALDDMRTAPGRNDYKVWMDADYFFSSGDYVWWCNLGEVDKRIVFEHYQRIRKRGNRGKRLAYSQGGKNVGKKGKLNGKLKSCTNDRSKTT